MVVLAHRKEFEADKCPECAPLQECKAKLRGMQNTTRSTAVGVRRTSLCDGSVIKSRSL